MFLFYLQGIYLIPHVATVIPKRQGSIQPSNFDGQLLDVLVTCLLTTYSLII